MSMNILRKHSTLTLLCLKLITLNIAEMRRMLSKAKVVFPKLAKTSQLRYRVVLSFTHVIASRKGTKTLS